MRILFVLLLALRASVAFGATTVILDPPLPAYPALLDHSCGGVRVSTFAAGFDGDGHVLGVVHAWTRCDAGRGRAHGTKTYSTWHSLVWDTSGRLLASAPTVTPQANPGFTATDDEGRTIASRPKSPGSPEYVAVLTIP
jgi:hypothetical protein